MSKEKVFFDGEFGKICGVLHRIDDISEIVIIVHGFGSSKDTSAISISNALNKIGLNALRIDLDNRGESDLEFTNSSVSNYVKQVQSTIIYVKNLGYKEISLIGGSFGGVVVMEVAELFPELKRLFLRCPGSGAYYKYLQEGKEEEYKRLKKLGYYEHTLSYDGKFKFPFSFIEDLEKYYPLTNIAKKIKIPVGIIHGDKDEKVDYRTTIDFSKNIKNCDLHIIKGAAHNLGVNGDFSESQKLLIDFFKQQF